MKEKNKFLLIMLALLLLIWLLTFTVIKVKDNKLFKPKWEVEKQVDSYGDETKLTYMVQEVECDLAYNLTTVDEIELKLFINEPKKQLVIKIVEEYYLGMRETWGHLIVNGDTIICKQNYRSLVISGDEYVKLFSKIKSIETLNCFYHDKITVQRRFNKNTLYPYCGIKNYYDTTYKFNINNKII